MIIDGQLATNLRCFGDRRQKPLGGALHLGFLRLTFATRDDPDLRVQLMLLEQPEGFFVISPEREVFDTMLLVSQDLLLELGNVLAPPIIRDLRDAHLGHHRSALFRGTLLVVERHDTPCRQVLQFV